MAHWKLTISYDGTALHGWQMQPCLPTVQQLLSAAIESVAGERVLPQGSGRTDAGVHALAQVASFSLAIEIPASNLLRALNRALPHSIRVVEAEIVPEEFHARYSAIAKTYEYRVFEGRDAAAQDKQTPRICSPFVAPFVWECRWPLDVAALQAAAAHFVGEHDFVSFAASDPEKQRRALPAALDTVRTLTASCWTRERIWDEDLLVYRVSGNGFLHHMVRNLVGTMVEAGRGSLAVDAMATILAARERSAAGPTAPASGLFLHSVAYPPPHSTAEPHEVSA